MKRLIILALTILLSVQVSYADVYQDFHDAVTYYSRSKYEKARTLFVSCQASGRFDSVSISVWISRCDAKISEQRRNAQAEAARYRRKLAEREANQYVYLSVNAAESGILFSSTESAMSEVMRKNGRSFHQSIDEAFTVVTVNVEMSETVRGSHFIADVSGMVRLGSAIDPNQFSGQWTVGPCKGESVESMNDAKRLALDKLNSELSVALDNLLNGRAQTRTEVSLDNTLAVYLGSGNGVKDESLSDFLNALYYYIDQNPDYQRNATIDPAVVEDMEAEYQRQGRMTRREERSEIGEQRGIRYMLRLSVEKRSDGSFFFAGNIFDLNTGYSIATAPEPKYKFSIESLNRDNQELAAAILAVGLGLKEWEIGEEIGGYKLAYCDGLHGLLLSINSYEPYRKLDISSYRSEMKANGMPSEEADKWRFPYADELSDMIDYKRKLGLRNIYWTEDIYSPGKHLVFNFSTGKSEPLKDSDSRTAAVVLIREF